MPSYIPPQGAKEKRYGISPPQGVRVKPHVIIPPPPPPPPEVYIDVLDVGSGIELIEVARVAFLVEHDLITSGLDIQSFIAENSFTTIEADIQAFIAENNFITMELKFPA